MECKLPHGIMKSTAHVLTASGLVCVMLCSHCLSCTAPQPSTATQAPVVGQNPTLRIRCPIARCTLLQHPKRTEMHLGAYAECKQACFTFRQLTKQANVAQFCLTDVNASTRVVSH